MKKLTMFFLLALLCANAAFAAQPEIDELRTHFRLEVDEVEGIKWIHDKATPKHFDSNTFYVYLGQQGDNMWARLMAGFVKEDWVFFKKIVINSDGQKYTIDFDYFKNKYKDVIKGKVIVEIIDVSAKPHIDFLKRIAQSKKTIIRYQGDNYKYDVVVSQKQKDALKRILRYYELASSN